MTDASDDEERGEGPLADEPAYFPTIRRQLASLRSDWIDSIVAAPVFLVKPVRYPRR